ncbi:hypothetical protein SNE40_008422 [Patella caerulea]|uniref:Uncharacterized protein n=1 Tax=Patella caerulea TaxID=87958 RepID=A0AAN8JYU3_PATCE
MFVNFVIERCWTFRQHVCVLIYLAVLSFLIAGVGTRNMDTKSQEALAKESGVWICTYNILDSLRTIIKTLQWSDVNIFYETADEEMVLYSMLYFEKEQLRFRTTIYDVTRLSSSTNGGILMDIYKMNFGEVNMILFLRNSTFELLKIANNFDASSNKTTNYRSGSRWIIMSSSMFKKQLLEFELQNMIVLTCSGCTVGHYTISYGNATSLECLRRDVTFYNDQKHVNCSVNALFPNIKHKYGKHHVLIGTLVSNVLQKHVDINNQTIYSGVTVELSDTLAKYLNFTYTFVQPNNGEYAGKTNDGKWQGLVGMLVRNEVDIVIADLTLTEERSKVIDFILPPFLINTWSIVYKRGIQVESNWVKIFRPFNAYVYIAILATVVVVAILLLLVQTDSTEGNGKYGCSPRNLLISILNNVLFLMSFLAARGDGVSAKKASVRLLVAFLWMFCVVLTGVYMGNLTAALTDTKYKKPFNSLKKLVELPDWKCWIRGYSLTRKLLRNSNDTLLMKIWKGLAEFNKTDPTIFDLDINVRVNKILTEGEQYVYFGDDARYFVLNANNCNLELVDGILSNYQQAIAVPKNSYLKSDLESAMEKLSASGYLTNLNDRVFKDNRPVHCMTKNTKRPLRLEDLLGAILIALIGMITAIFVLFNERCHNYCLPVK